ncbi:hypothetical protein [Pseudarthrobacter sp. BIM B-2242]|uniref:hypothetical protein n=1 Tax=Pseudarthrobacter sp. BIM B-2242 TaxID=2772401 RepID=UPI00168BC65E|nr:hypothetical protein [Pseudarthrobacter sp. BIM B-2242]QOD05696.1 hypothetical protein IDT60_21880 [Pseudarthrobacter sp. BIM B-2242]
MTSVRARRAAATILLAAGSMFLLPATGHASETCMRDYNGNWVCGASGTGPTSGPGSYTGFNGVQDGTPGDIGPDGRPMTAAKPPAWESPDWTPPPVPAAAQPAPNPAGLSNVPPAGVNSTLTPPPAAAPADGTTKELPPGAVAESAADAARDTGSTATPSAAPGADPSATPSGEATPAPTMTEMTQGTPRTSRAAADAVTAPTTADATRASESEPFSPVPLLAVLGGLAIAGAVIWFVPGIRNAILGLLGRGNH